MKLPAIAPWLIALLLLSTVARGAAATPATRGGGEPSHPRHLRAAQSAICRIKASEPDNNTQLLVREGEIYDFSCDNSRRWKDAGTRVSPAGDAPDWYRAYMSLYTHWKRCPDAPWFSLIGKVGLCDKRCFLIGAGKSGFHVGQDGLLYCFANDVNGFYWNNSGEILVRVTRRR